MHSGALRSTLGAPGSTQEHSRCSRAFALQAKEGEQQPNLEALERLHVGSGMITELIDSLG